MADRLRVFSSKGIRTSASLPREEADLAAGPRRSAGEAENFGTPSSAGGHERHGNPREPEIKPADAGPPASLARLVAGLDADLAPSLEAEWSQTEGAEVFPAKTHVVFRLGDHPFALPCAAVEALLRLPPYTPLPLVSHWLLGVCRMDDGLVSVTDLGAFLGLAPLVRPSGNMALRVRWETMTSLMVVARVEGLARLVPHGVPAAGFPHLKTAFLNGMAERDGSAVPILDPAAIMQSRAFAWPAPDIPGC